jgi:amidase
VTDAAVVQLRAAQSEFGYTFGGRDPAVVVPPGTIVELETEDCFGGLVRTVNDLPSAVCQFPYLNPVTGPIAVDGATPGDVLAVHFVDIRPRRDWAVSSTFPHFGALTTTGLTAMLHPPLDELVWIYDVDVEGGTSRFHARRSSFELDLPLDPMHGTIGVAPAFGEVFMTITPGSHGGNMDSPELRAGTTVYLQVNVPGAMLSIGDGHCRQGEGEVGGVGIEAAMDTVVIVDLVKGAAPAWPRLESDDYIMTLASARPLEDAFRASQRDIVHWVGGLLDLDTLDALQLVSQMGLAPVANVVDTNYTMVAKFPVALLGEKRAYEGTHQRLRASGRRYLASR